MSDPAGFRRMAGGASSIGGTAFVGLDSPSNETADLPLSAVRNDICRALYGAGFLRGGVVPIASFSDFYCPYCRVQTQELADLADRLAGRITVVWHELPLLGDTSVLAAKAALAAKQQDAYVRFQERLLSSPFRATEGYLKALSHTLGIEYPKLAAAMNSHEVEQEIRTSAALAKIFGFIGTPALVVGRTVIQGKVGVATLRKIIEVERNEGWSQVC